MSRVPLGAWNSGTPGRLLGGSASLGAVAATRQHPVGVEDGVDALERAEQRLEVRWITQLEVETETSHSVGSGVTARRQDVDVVVGQHGADVAQEFRSVEGLDLDRRLEHADAVAVPLDLDEPVSIGG